MKYEYEYVQVFLFLLSTQEKKFQLAKKRRCSICARMTGWESRTNTSEKKSTSDRRHSLHPIICRRREARTHRSPAVRTRERHDDGEAEGSKRPSEEDGDDDTVEGVNRQEESSLASAERPSLVVSAP